MRYHVIFSTIISLVIFSASARAQIPTLIYSFENGDSPNSLDGFAANGGGTTVTQSTVGATNGSSSLAFSMVGGAYFSGALTANLVPQLFDPETEAINFDLTVPVAGQFTGAFARIGISEFGIDNSDPTNGPYTDQIQTTANAEVNIDLLPGTYNFTIPLQARSNPITFEGPLPFSANFGSDSSTQLMPLTGFEFYINKSTDDPITVYIDNVKAEPLLGDTNDDFSVDNTDFATLTANLGKTVTGGYADADFNGDGVVNADDVSLFQLGLTEFHYLNYETLPEPGCVGLFGLAFVAAMRNRRRR